MNPNFQRDFQRGLNEIGFWNDLYSWETLATFVVYFILGVVVAIAAYKRGRDGFSWFLVAFFTTPIFAAVLLLLFPAREAQSVNDKALEAAIRKGKRKSYW